MSPQNEQPTKYDDYDPTAGPPSGWMSAVAIQCADSVDPNYVYFYIGNVCGGGGRLSHANWYIEEKFPNENETMKSFKPQQLRCDVRFILSVVFDIFCIYDACLAEYDMCLVWEV